MSAILAGIYGPLLGYLRAHQIPALAVGAVVAVVAGYFLTGPHGRWTR
jgi:hypothetical protein